MYYQVLATYSFLFGRQRRLSKSPLELPKTTVLNQSGNRLSMFLPKSCTTLSLILPTWKIIGQTFTKTLPKFSTLALGLPICSLTAQHSTHNTSLVFHFEEHTTHLRLLKPVPKVLSHFLDTSTFLWYL